ncbi:hypothetical protein [Plantactinospora sp. KBS50]|uniref:hypothetical protein n=1 Tax=Plantactinospora sp. KBS50 TaxID=2024580 RepID=UPI000BAB1EF3|nr:hypothetical protein [Plantactinospora sp. KBS50]ASW54807.1 hypothetical protein CIK06_12370 [Plantactinospora sp. KBS50]
MRTVDLRVLAAAAWRRTALPLLGLAAGLAAAQAVTPLLPARYEAQASVLVMADAPRDRSADVSLALAQNLAPTVARLAGSREVASATARQLGLPESAVIGNVHGSSEPGLQIVTVRSDAGSADRAAAIANAASRALGEQLGRLEIGGDTPVTTRVLDTANPPSRPDFPKPPLNGALGALVGLLAGWGAMLLRDRFDGRIRDVAGLEARLGLPVVGILPDLPKRFDRHHAPALLDRGEVAAATRATISALSLLAAGSGRRLLVMGVHDDDGAALLSALLGLAMAREGQRVTIADAAVRDPVLSGHFPETSATWQQLLATGRPPGQQPDLPTLTVLPTEPAPSLSREQARELGRLLDTAAGRADCVIVHAPPVLASCDTAALAEHVDGVLLVVSARRTDPAGAVRAAALLRRLNLPLVGTVAVGRIDQGSPRPAADAGRVDPLRAAGPMLPRYPGARRGRDAASARAPRALSALPAAADPPAAVDRLAAAQPVGGNRLAQKAQPVGTHRLDESEPDPAGRTGDVPSAPPRQPHQDHPATLPMVVEADTPAPPSPLDGVARWSTPVIAGGRMPADSALGRPLAPRGVSDGPRPVATGRAQVTGVAEPRPAGDAVDGRRDGGPGHRAAH